MTQHSQLEDLTETLAVLEPLVTDMLSRELAFEWSALQVGSWVSERGWAREGVQLDGLGGIWIERPTYGQLGGREGADGLVVGLAVGDTVLQ